MELTLWGFQSSDDPAECFPTGMRGWVFIPQHRPTLGRGCGLDREGLIDSPSQWLGVKFSSLQGVWAVLHSTHHRTAIPDGLKVTTGGSWDFLPGG